MKTTSNISRSNQPSDHQTNDHDTLKNKDDETDIQINSLHFTKTPYLLNEKIKGRQICNICGSSRRFICFKCRRLTIPDELRLQYVPTINDLPFKIHIIRHPTEKPSKSSAIPLQALCPKCINIYEYPELPKINEGNILADNTILLFPGKNSVDSKVFDWTNVQNVISIDCTWLQTKEILKEQMLSSLPKVALTSRKTLFWRFQFFSDDFLSSAEAIYFLLRDFFTTTSTLRYDGRYDDLLFFFALQYEIIKEKNKGDENGQLITSIEKAKQRRLRAQELNQLKKRQMVDRHSIQN